MRQEITDFNLKVGDYVVSMRSKYSFEEFWNYHRELLSVGWCYYGRKTGEKDYTWMNDWDEGQDDVEFLGIINVDEISEKEFVLLLNYYEKG